MYTVRVTVPLNFQSGELNCQSLLDELTGDYCKPDSKTMIGESFIAIWDLDDREDADDALGTLDMYLEGYGLELDPNEPSYSGVRIGVYEEDGMLVVPEPEEELDDEDDDEDEE